MGELLWRALDPWALCTYDQSTLQQAAAQMGFRGRVTTKKEATRSVGEGDLLNTCINGREKSGLLEGDEKIWGA